MNVVSLVLPAGFTIAGIALAARGNPLAKLGIRVPQTTPNVVEDDAPLHIVATPLSVRPIGGAAATPPTPVEETPMTPQTATITASPPPASESADAVMLNGQQLLSAETVVESEGSRDLPFIDTSKLEPISLEIPPDDVKPKRSLGDWFRMFTFGRKSAIEAASSDDGPLEDGIVSEPTPYTSETIYTNGHSNGTAATAPAATVLQGLDAQGLLIEAKPAQAAPDLEAIGELERNALAAADVLRKTRDGDNARRAAADLTAEQMAANRWWMRLNPDLEPDDTDGRLAVTASLASLRGITWAQSLLAEAIDQEPEERVRARLYGTLARIGGAEERRPLYDAALTRSTSDRSAAIDAVASAGVSWAMDFLTVAMSAAT